MQLFKVEGTFMVTGLGLTLTGGKRDKILSAGSAIKIIKPDQTVLHAIVKHLAFSPYWSVTIVGDFVKEDIPIGSEVWMDSQV